MKKTLFTVLTIAFFSANVYAEGVDKKVCVKDNNGKETCKTIKVHKKLDGTKLPEKK